MSTPDRNAAPHTHEEMAAILFAPGKGHSVLPVTHKATDQDDAAARAFLGLPARSTEHATDDD